MFLTDEEILELVILGVITSGPPRLEDPFSRESPIQPCSVDLTIGKIFVPGSGPNEPGGGNAPKTQQHILRPGETAVVETAEEFRLPSEIGGFGFPPAHVSRNGILMTNPGHIDPGYQGHMSFTLVNMGREDYSLIGGKAICTVLLFRLGNPPRRDFSQRGSSVGSDFTGLLDRLSHDFLNVNERAKGFAEGAVRQAELKVKIAQVWVPLLTAVVVGVGSLLLNIFVFNPGLERRIESVEQRVQLEQRLLSVEEVQAIRELLQNQGSQ